MTCPNCERIIDQQVQHNGARVQKPKAAPIDGDVSVCLYCLRILIWREPRLLAEGHSAKWEGFPKSKWEKIPEENKNHLVQVLVNLALRDRPIGSLPS